MKIKLIMRIAFLFSTSICAAQNSNTISINEDLQLIHLEDSIFIHVSWHSIEPYGRFPSNGMIIIRNGNAVMIDTPMDTEKTKTLVKFIEDSLQSKITDFIPGHYHDDCIGGLAYLHETGVNSRANALTIQKCKELNLPVPKQSFSETMKLNFEGIEMNLNYFGAGHTADNITVYIPKYKILFGGCLIKSINSKGLGNTADAIIDEWGETTEKVLNAYPDVKIVIPGHGNYGGKELLSHTIELVKQNRN
jgi:metallo-beta-lactamase class B